MKTIQMIMLIGASFGTGFIVADGLAQMSPVLQMNPPPTAGAIADIQTNDCERFNLVSTATDFDLNSVALTHQHSGQGMSSPHTKQDLDSELSAMTMPLDLYHAVSAAYQRPATELILQIEPEDFEQMLALQQQDVEYSPQIELYQQQLSEFMSGYPSVIHTLELRCGSRFCLLQLELQDMAAWPTLFKTLTAQHWWQSISYQNRAAKTEWNDNSPNRMTLLLQQDWAGESHSQSVAVTGGRHFH